MTSDKSSSLARWLPRLSLFDAKRPVDRLKSTHLLIGRSLLELLEEQRVPLLVVVLEL